MNTQTLINTTTPWSPTVRLAGHRREHRHLQQAFRQRRNSADRGSATSLSRTAGDHCRPRRVHQQAILYDEDHSPKHRRWNTHCQSPRRRQYHPRDQDDLATTSLAGSPGEKITEGLDGLRARLKEYVDVKGAFRQMAGGDHHRRPVAWRGVHRRQRPCAGALRPALCQEAGLVPIVEPEVLMDGEHSMARCRTVTEDVLRQVFDQLYRRHVLLEGMILKPNMVVPGLSCAQQESVEEVADATVACLRRVVPAAVPRIAFLSGGQSPVPPRE